MLYARRVPVYLSIYQQNGFNYAIFPQAADVITFAKCFCVCVCVNLKLCEAWKQGLECKYAANCMYTHGPQEIRVPENSTSYKTLPCKDQWKPGGCKYGDRCYYLHYEETNLQP